MRGDSSTGRARGAWLRARLAYGGYRLAATLARVVPARAVEPVAALAGWSAARILRSRRRVVARTLTRVSARSLTGRTLAGAVDAVFVSYARYWVETFRLPDTTRATLDERIRVHGLAHLDRACATGRGAVIVTAHLGGWDFGGAWLAAHGYPITTVVEALDEPLFSWFARLRSSLGIEVVRHDRLTLDRLRAALSDGRVVALVCDRDLGGRGVPVRFFGEPTTLPAGPARLALDADVPVLAAAVYSRPRGTHDAVLRPPLAVRRSGDRRSDVAALTEAIAAELEVLIAAAPTQWHLLQPNWPADKPPGRRRPRS